MPALGSVRGYQLAAGRNILLPKVVDGEERVRGRLHGSGQIPKHLSYARYDRGYLVRKLSSIVTSQDVSVSKLDFAHFKLCKRGELQRNGTG